MAKSLVCEAEIGREDCTDPVSRQYRARYSRGDSRGNSTISTDRTLTDWICSQLGCTRTHTSMRVRLPGAPEETLRPKPPRPSNCRFRRVPQLPRPKAGTAEWRFLRENATFDNQRRRLDLLRNRSRKRNEH
jgi:hypothetical protein